MLHRATRFLPRIAAGVTARRSFSTDLPGAPAVAEQMLVKAWKKVVPNIDPPKIPLSFVQPRPPVPGSIPSKLALNFYLPYSSELSNKEVDMIIVPATTGQMGILPGHVATMTELKPGVLSVHEGNETAKYFISGGFAFVHPNSIADIVTIEAVPLDRINPNLIQKGLAEYSQKLSSATTEYERAEAQIGVDVHNALNYALIG